MACTPMAEISICRFATEARGDRGYSNTSRPRMVAQGTWGWAVPQPLRWLTCARWRRRSPVNPADNKDNLEPLLPDHDHEVQPRESLRYEELQKFMADLRRYEDRSGRKTGLSTVAYAVEFAALRGARVDEVCQAQWKEID